MSATKASPDKESTQTFPTKDKDMELPTDELIRLDFSDVDLSEAQSSRRTTDLVRLYLQEIGRVRLLGKDEEVSEAQKVQRYVQLVELRDTEAETKGGYSRPMLIS
ncbi:Sigma-70 factor, region 1.2 [Limnospira platensis C1]|nr:Sigma-70 factor, region 1.2 [Arthrospira platensis C1]